MSDLLDRYQLRARIQPAVLAALPVAWTVAVVFGATRDLTSGAVAFVGAAGVAYFLAQLVRDRGRALEGGLWASWGGPPTTQLLQGLADEPEPVLSRRWAMMGLLMPGIAGAPDPTRPGTADAEIYISHLRERTRDSNSFPLVAAENAGYGFRRNMYGLRPLAIGLAVGAAALAFGSVLYELVAGHGARTLPVGAMLLADLLALAAWIWVVKPEWVRVQAFAYARALLGAAESLVTAQA